MFTVSGGRFMNTADGHTICVATITGAKSGKQRKIPVIHVPYYGGILLVASIGGAPKNPAWYYNVISNPDIDVHTTGRKLKLRARLATREEKARVWPHCIATYPAYQDYQDRSSRDIPVFICDPIE